MSPPIRIGPFELVSPIGRGGMGQVWEGRHRQTELPVAIKVASGHRAAAELESRLRTELQAVASFHHPCVVQVYDFGHIDAAVVEASDGQLELGRPYLVMELVSGGRLDELTIDSWPVLRTVIITLLEALAHVHARGFIHRDLKPANVLLGERRLVEADAAGHGLALPLLKLTDFGVAIDYQSPPTDVLHEAEAKGTPSYMAPEVIKGSVRDQGPWTDLYTLGCLVHQLAGGRLPFETDDLRQLLRCHLHVPAPPIEPRFPVPSDFASWVARLLAKAPRQRFRWAAEAGHAVLALRGEMTGTRPMPTGERPARPADQAPGGSLEDATTRVEIPVQQSVDDNDRAVGPSHHPPPRVPVTWRRPTPPGLRVRLDGAGLGLVGLRTVPMIGRESERSVLWRALRRVQDTKKAQVVTLLGGAGFGKTCLVRWLSRRIRELGLANVLHVEHTCEPGSGGIGTTLARLLRCTGLAPDQMRERVSRFVDSYGLLAKDVDELVSLISQPASDTASDDPRRHFTLLRRLLAGLCEERPVVVCLDDVQWASSLIEFTHEVLDAQAVMPIPVLFVLTANEEDLPDELGASVALQGLLQHPDVHSVSVGQLPAAQMAELVGQLVPLDRALIARCVERASGNPGLAMSLVRHAAKRQAWVETPWGFSLDPRDRLEPPHERCARWAERLERVAPRGGEGCRALELAAALGPEVDGALWKRLAAHFELDVPVGLVEALVRAGLAVRKAGGWRFRQPALRAYLEQRAYEAGRWAGYHDLLSQLVCEEAEAGRVAHHLVEAGRFEQSLELLQQAAELARDRGDYAAALSHLARCERALLELDLPADHPQRLLTQVRRAHLGALLGELRPARRRLEAIEREASRAELSDVVGAAQAVLGLVNFWSGDLDAAKAAFEGGAERLADLGDEAGHVRCLRGLAEIAKRRGEWNRAHQLYHEATEVLADTGRSIDRAATLAGYADLLARTGARQRALELVREAQNAYRLAGSRHGELAMSNNVGDLLREAGDLEGAERHYRQAMVELAEIGALEARIAEINLGLVRLARGEVDAAGRYFEHVLGALRHTGATNLVYAWAGLLSVHARRGEWSRWEVALAEVSARVARGGLFDGDLAWLLERAGDEAAGSDKPERAQLPWSLAQTQWQGLGRSERAEALAARTSLSG